MNTYIRLDAASTENLTDTITRTGIKSQTRKKIHRQTKGKIELKFGTG
jgi:hypothetical protein